MLALQTVLQRCIIFFLHWGKRAIFSQRSVIRLNHYILSVVACQRLSALCSDNKGDNRMRGCQATLFTGFSCHWPCSQCMQIRWTVSSTLTLSLHRFFPLWKAQAQEWKKGLPLSFVFLSKARVLQSSPGCQTCIFNCNWLHFKKKGFKYRPHTEYLNEINSWTKKVCCLEFLHFL